MKKLHFLAGLAAGMMSVSGAAESASPAQPLGVWSNPKNSVHVRLQPCGESVCGTVVWASEKAKAAAKRGGTESLVGTQLFREFQQVEPGAWKGRVYVPDMGRTFAGRITALDSRTIKGRGCLIGGLFCKSQTWKRIA